MAARRHGISPGRGVPWPRLGLDGLALGLGIAALGLLPLAAWAFWPRYLSQVGSADGYTHAHAILGTAWLFLLAIQPWLARTRRWPLHRALGRAGIAVGAAFVVSGLLSSHRGLVRMDADEFASHGFFVYMPLAMTAIFAMALLLGIAWRRSPAVHGRFMACTALPLLDPVFARILGFHLPPLPAEFLYQVPATLATALVLGALAGSLPGNAPGRGGFLLFACATMSLFLLFFAIPYSQAWLAFVEWFRALPIT